jgi:hypothetical protein
MRFFYGKLTWIVERDKLAEKYRSRIVVISGGGSE